MAGSIFDWTVAPATNSSSDAAINWAENQAPSTVNDSARQTLARVAEFIKDLGSVTSTNAVNQTGGSANAYTLTVNSGFTAFRAGLICACTIHAANTAASTINVNAVGVKNIVNRDAGALTTGQLAVGTLLILVSDATQWRAINLVSAAATVNPATLAFGPFTAIASATTTDLSTVATVGVSITGTTTITSFGTGANLLRHVKFAGALLLTYNATSLILPTAANITTAANDTATLLSDASGNVTCIAYQRASGAALLTGSVNPATMAFGPFTGIASATTTDLSTLTTVGASITGTTTITSFGTGANLLRIVKFAAALTLTHNATSLILPGGANITTQAGDTLDTLSDGSGNWTVTDYVRAANTPAGRNVGVAANNLVALDGTAKYPAADGSLITGISTGTLATRQVLTSGTTYTTPANCKRIFVREVGGGGGGGRAGSSAVVGTGGGGGEYAEIIISTPAASYTYAIGAAGTAGSSGGVGGNTSFNSVVAVGGGGGSSNSTSASGGTGGTGTASWRSNGGGSSQGAALAGIDSGNQGGSSVLGGGGRGAPTFGTSDAGSRGGGGGGTGQSGTSAAGGAGIIIVDEYYN